MITHDFSDFTTVSICSDCNWRTITSNDSDFIREVSNHIIEQHEDRHHFVRKAKQSLASVA